MLKLMKNPVPGRHLLPLAILGGLAMTAAAAPIWPGHEDFESGILTVYNPGTPVEPAEVIRPRPQWRLGGDGEAATLFGLVTDAQRADDGTTYLLDAVMSTVYEVGPEGDVRRTLGQEGDGPGEFRNAVSLALLPDRNLGIVEVMPSHMVVLDAAGLPRPGIELGDGRGGMGHVQRVVVANDELVMGLMSTRLDAGKAEIRHILGTFDLDGALRHEVLSTREEQSGGSISISSGRDNDFVNNWILLSDGRVAVYRRSHEYLIEVFAADGTPLRRIRREYQSVRRPEADLAAQREDIERMNKRFGKQINVELEEMAPDISEIIPRPDGRMWVLTSQGRQECPAGCLVFDVIDQQGRFRHQVRLEADYSPDDDNFVIRGNHLYVLKEAQNAPDRTFTSGGGGMMMVQMSTGGGQADEDPDEEPRPYEVICYELPPTP